MRVSHSYRDFVLDQLSGVPGLRPKAMFGGIGLYAGDRFFGILAGDLLYFKVDESNRGDYEASGSSAFKPYADRPMTMPYFDVPIAVIEDPDELARWAARSIAIATTPVPRRARRPRTAKRTRRA
jgi:DNA transformation protein and related proteins